MNSKRPVWKREIDRALFRMYACNMESRFHSVLDHIRYEDDKVIGEPYEVSMEDLEDFISFCKKNDLTFYITGHGVKHHPDCIKVVVEME